jgi:cytochrome c oxidase subunit IV
VDEILVESKSRAYAILVFPLVVFVFIAVTVCIAALSGG